jgi:RHS repeat-associated protein
VGTSGVCDVQYKVDDGDWTDWLLGTTDTSASFTGESGHTYAFRLRTWDNVSNETADVFVASNPFLATDSVTKHYYANGQRVATRVGGSLYYVHSDLLGSTVAVSDAAGGEVGRVQYDPYGEVLTSTLPADLTDRLFTGQRFDSSTGLYYYNARYYDPHLGRFLQPDTIVPEPGNPQALNRYTYVYNNPLKYVDPSSYFTEEQIKQFFGLDPDAPWEDVLAFFEEGGELEGRWGWLRVLRHAELGDKVQVLEGWNIWGYDPERGIGVDDFTTLTGTFVERNGQLFIQSGQRTFTLKEMAQQGNAYYVSTARKLSGLFFADRRYQVLKWGRSRVDWADIGLDVTGLALSPFDATPAAELSVPAGIFVDLYSIIKDVNEWNAKGKPAPWEAPLDWADFGADVGGLTPVGGAVWDIAGIGIGLSKGLYLTP